MSEVCPTCGEVFERPPSSILRSERSYCSKGCWYGRNTLSDFFEERGDDECWPWTGGLDKDGYGQSTSNGKSYRGHRLVYEDRVGPIPGGLTLDHTCRNRSCVNPEHLEPVSNRENILRGEGFAAQNARKTHCKHGHEFTPENTYFYKSDRYLHGRRQCKQCVKKRAAARNRRES